MNSSKTYSIDGQTLVLPQYIDKNPKISGIYYILCKITGKVYIGSSKNMNRRWRNHISQLNLGNNKCTKLQRAWTKYSGKDNFQFGILEFCPIEHRIEREYFYINRDKTYLDEFGYNIKNEKCGMQHSELSIEKFRRTHAEQKDEMTQKSINKRGKEFEIVSPEGELIKVKGIRKFSRDNNLQEAQLKRVINGENNTVKGWHLLSYKKIEYKFLDPYCNLHIVKDGDLLRFSREIGLGERSLSKLWTNGYNQKSKGWERFDAPEENFVTLINTKDNKEYKISKNYISYFFKERNLLTNTSSPKQLLNGIVKRYGDFKIKEIVDKNLISA